MLDSEETLNVVLPEGACLYSHQVAGHEYDGRSKLGILKHKNGFIIKPVKGDVHQSAKELLFYENVFCNKGSDPIIKELACFVPKFHGTCTAKIQDKELKFICLEDICEKFSKPSILDIKIGKITYDPEASVAKIEYEKSKYLYGEVLGFRILGMKIYRHNEEVYELKDKKFGKQLVPENIKTALESFLTSNVFINCCILCGALHKLTELESWFKRQRRLAFYSSSLLFVYEGLLSVWLDWLKNYLHQFCGLDSHGDESSAISIECLVNVFFYNNDVKCQTCSLHKNICHKILSNCDLTRVAIIDCAHVFPTSKEDSNYMFGLEKLKQFIQNIMDDQIKLLKVIVSRNEKCIKIP